MDQILLLGFPLPVALALAALVLGLLGLARVLASLGKPGRLRIPCEDEPLHPAELESRPN